MQVVIFRNYALIQHYLAHFPAVQDVAWILNEHKSNNKLLVTHKLAVCD